MKLIDNADKWYRMHSVQAMLAIGLIQGMLAVATESELAAHVPLTDWTWYQVGRSLTFLVAFLGGLGRLLKQNSVSGTDPA